ncbi:MAG: putative membrane protein [Pseudohongiellaceae bacterium]|jgi:putative membrane protein
MSLQSKLFKARQGGKRELMGIFVRGVAMGAADLVPGVSGGTIAFITGIYSRLLNALKSLTPQALGILMKQGPAAFWSAIDGNFLLTLFAGIICSIMIFAKFVSISLERYPILVWSFFFGLVVASVIYLVQKTPKWQFKELAALITGTVCAVVITLVRPVELPSEWWMVMIAGSVAICAMILPGISGSFILLLMGMYKVLIVAVEELDIILLLSFASGCLFGLLAFSHLLSALLKHYESIVFATLTGFLIGSLNLLWPWKQVLETTVNRHGEVVPLVQVNITPFHYVEVTAQPAFLGMAVVCLLSGLVLILLLEKIVDTKN